VHLDNPGSDLLARVSKVAASRESRNAETFRVLGASPRDERRWLLELEGVSTREDAAELTNAVVMVARDELDLGRGEVLVCELGGRQVLEDGTVVGSVRSVYFNGAHDVLVVSTACGLVDFPLTEDHVTGLDDDGALVVSGFAPFVELAYDPPGERGP
jgi:ribosomal 30S subunit maturation factor RimM